MNTINTNSMVHVAMDGQSLYNINRNTASNTAPKQVAAQSITPTGAIEFVLIVFIVLLLEKNGKGRGAHTPSFHISNQKDDIQLSL